MSRFNELMNSVDSGLIDAQKQNVEFFDHGQWNETALISLAELVVRDVLDNIPVDERPEYVLNYNNFYIGRHLDLSVNTGSRTFIHVKEMNSMDPDFDNRRKQLLMIAPGHRVVISDSKSFVRNLDAVLSDLLEDR